MSQTLKVGDLADAVMKEMEAYKDLSRDALESAITSSSNLIRDEIKKTAPVKTGTYAKSWRSSKTRDDADSFGMTVYSPKRYMYAHLLEHGHAKRNGGRVKAIPHIGPAEEKGMEKLVTELQKKLEG